MGGSLSYREAIGWVASSMPPYPGGDNVLAAFFQKKLVGNQSKIDNRFIWSGRPGVDYTP